MIPAVADSVIPAMRTHQTGRQVRVAHQAHQEGRGSLERVGHRESRDLLALVQERQVRPEKQVRRGQLGPLALPVRRV